MTERHARTQTKTPSDRVSAPPRPALISSQSSSEGALAQPETMSVQSFAALQRLGGNRSASRLVSAGDPANAQSSRQVHRAPPTMEDRVAALEKQQKAMAKKQQALQIDAKWRAQFNEIFSNYRQSTYRISGSFQKALTNFQATQTAQLQMDAIWNQVIALAGTVAIAALFEPVAGRFGTWARNSTTRIPTWLTVEVLENPANALASGLGNVGTTSAANKQTNDRGAQGVSGGGVQASDPLTYLAGNLEAVEGHTRDVEGAFAKRATEAEARTPEQWETWNPTGEEAKYNALILEMKDKIPKVDVLKPADEITLIIERHLWAAWIRSHVPVVRSWGDHANRKTAQERTADDYDSVAMSLGSVVEDKLNALKISEKAGVTLSGHWYSGNSDNYREKLFDWANKYPEKIATK